LGRRGPALSAEPYTTPRGQSTFWIGQPGKPVATNGACDFSAVEAGYISVTPLQVDLTCHRALGEVDAWL
jgi:5'-nucleotidase